MELIANIRLSAPIIVNEEQFTRNFVAFTKSCLHKEFHKRPQVINLNISTELYLHMYGSDGHLFDEDFIQ